MLSRGHLSPRKTVSLFCAVNRYCTSSATKRQQSSSSDNKTSLPSFEHFPLHQGLMDFLQKSQIHTPTYIQYSLLASLQSNYNKPHYITSPTGSGKTLSYLIPLINHLKRQEEEQKAILTQSQRPRALVLTANKELVLQTKNVAKSIAHFTKIKAEGINIGRTIIEEKRSIESGIDILVSTFERLMGYYSRKELFLSNLEWIVIDEVDTLFEMGKLQNIVQKGFLSHTIAQHNEAWRSSHRKQADDFVDPPRTRLLLSGTTTPPGLKQFLETKFHKDSLITIADKKTHINLQNIKHEFLECSSYDLHDLIRSLIFRQRNMKTMVFCNTVSSLINLQYFFEEQGIPVCTLHSQLSKEMRRKNYEMFRDSNDGQGSLSGDRSSQGFKSQQASGSRILLSTDLGARGLHFPNLSRVINYDFPLSGGDYLQRAGRTGRAGEKGLVISIYKKRHLPIISELKDCSFDKPINVQNSAYAYRNRDEQQGVSPTVKYQRKRKQEPRR